MRFHKILIPTILSMVAFSCVEDEIVFRDKGDQIRFTRSLASVAIDENPTLEVDIINRITGANNIASYELSYTSSNPEVIDVNDEGVLFPQSGSQSQSATISVTATTVSGSGNNATPVQISVANGDEIIVGRITLSENEALGFPEDDRPGLIANGFAQRGVINNRVSEIDFEERDKVLTATFFNFKNEDVDNPDITWSSNNTSVIAIDNTGLLTPQSMGTTTITASAVINGETVKTEPLTITVSNQTVVEEEEEPVVTTTILGSGTIQSNSSYDAGGDFQIIENNGVVTINLFDNFTSGGRVPDLVLYLSNQTNTNTGAQFISEDIEAEGKQSFVVPEGVDVNNYSNVLIYCRQFSARVGFGVINR